MFLYIKLQPPTIPDMLKKELTLDKRVLHLAGLTRDNDGILSNPIKSNIDILILDVTEVVKNILNFNGEPINDGYEKFNAEQKPIEDNLNALLKKEGIFINEPFNILGVTKWNKRIFYNELNKSYEFPDWVYSHYNNVAV